MATYSELQTRVSRRLIDAPASLTAEVPKLVNEAYRTAQKLHNFWIMKTSITLPTVSSPATRVLAAVPSNFKEYRKHPYRTSEFGGPYKMAVLPSRQAALANVGEDSEGPPSYILETEPDDTGVSNWEVWPLPEGGSDYSDGEYRVVVPYWRYLPLLVAGSDASWLTDFGEEWIVAKATAMGFAVDWDADNTVIWESLATKKWKEILQADMTKQLSGMDTLVPYLGPQDMIFRG